MSPGPDLGFLQGLTEEEFSELVLIPLLESMGYQEIRYYHSPRELGKDIVFSREDPIDGRETLCAVVKMRGLSGSVSDSRSGREVLFQVSQSLQEPVIDPRTGEYVHVTKAYIVTPHQVSASALESIRGELKVNSSRVSILDGPAVLRKIREHLPNLLVSIQTPERRFIQSLLMRLLSSRTSRPLSPSKATSLVEVYTAGDLAPTTPEAAALISFARPLEVPRTLGITEALDQSDALVIVADVGAGKTSLLQKLSIDLLEAARLSDRDPLPLLVPLHRLPAEAFASGRLDQAIADFLESDGFGALDLSDRSRFVLLLDGFDEISDPSFTGKKAFDRLRRAFRKVAITTRPSRVPEVSSEFSFYQLRPFDDADMIEFLGKWFGPATDLPGRLHVKITNDPVLRLFCRTPLMLTLFAILAERLPIDQLPTRRTRIYEEIADLLLGGWDDMRGVQNFYPRDLRALVLERLALELQRRTERRFHERLLHDEATAALGSVAARGIGGNERLLCRELIYRSSLIRPSGEGHLEFVHLSFQEYFAARYMARASGGDGLDRTLFEDWWRGTWTFYFGIKRTLEDLRLPRRTKTRRAEALGAFLSEADYTPEEKRREIIALIGAEILRQPNLDLDSAYHYLAFGLDLVEQMLKELRDNVLKDNYFNLALLAILLADARGLQAIRKPSKHARFLRRDEILHLLGAGVALLDFEEGLSTFEHFCSLLASTMHKADKGTRLKVWSGLRDLSETILQYRSAAPVPREHYVRAQRSLFDAARVARMSRAKFDADKLSHWQGD